MSQGLGSFIQRIRGLIEDPRRIKRAVVRRMPGVLSAGARAVTKKVHYLGLESFRKEYNKAPGSMECFRREIDARRIFNGNPWVIPIKERGENWFTLPFLPEKYRLDNVAESMNRETRLELATQALSILLDIHSAGYLHGDFHSLNLFWFRDQLMVGDFEKLTPYPEGQRPPFRDSFDLTGKAPGISLPGDPQAPAVYYSTVAPGPRSLESVLDIPLPEAMQAFEHALREEIRNVCLHFHSLDDQRYVRAERIYSSFSLPYFVVEPHEVQRDSSKRLARLGVTREKLAGARLLDLGCNIGGMILESQKFEPAFSQGVEFDQEKVSVANRVAAYNGLNNVRFMQANVEHLTVEDLGEPFDVVYCFALVTHLKEPERLYWLLGQITKRTLYFEGNRETSIEEVEANLRQNGFKEVEFLGPCDDDFMPDNNTRPLFVARK